MKDELKIKKSEVMTNGVSPQLEVTDVATAVAEKKVLTTEEIMAIEKKRIEEAQGASTGPFSVVDLTKAINELYDYQERALVNFIFLGELAKAFKENRPLPSVEVIEVAVPQNVLTYEVKSNFKTWGFRETPTGYEYEYSVPLNWEVRIPVKIYVYKERFKLFDNPERVWASTDGAFIPNPFDSYWRIRKLVHSKLRKGLKLSSEKL